MLYAVTGALAGVFHVLAGPDHLAAVAPLAVDGPRRGWLAGWTWGIGHASGVVVVALLAVLFRDALPPTNVISGWSERLVGAALIVVGVWALRRSMRLVPAPHVHGPVLHDHLHVQAGPRWIRRLGHAHASFCLGVLHGMAGSSHFLGVVPALALPTRADAVTYISAFGAGTVAAMTVFAALVSHATGHARRHHDAHRALLTAAALLAIIIGGIWLMPDT
ncbi:MAG: sulfite exporter TauE/SafE family protein [Vicinamibacterales bacterium]